MPRMSRREQPDSTTENKEEIQGKWDKLKSIYGFVVSYFKWVYFISKVYILWIVIHYISVQLYVKYCVPSSIWGFITSPIMVSSPHCKATRWVLHTGANTIDNMWNTIGVWFSTQLLQIN
jgi:hypothetical protein